MSCVTLLPSTQKNIVTTLTTRAFTWYTPWMPAIAADLAEATLKIANLNNMDVCPAVQVAECRTDNPDAPVSINGGNPKTATGEYFYDNAASTGFNLGTLTTGNTFMRFGIGHNSTPTGLGVADVALQIALRQQGMLLAAWSGHIRTDSGATDIFIPISGWMPGASVVKVEPTFSITSLIGNFQVLLTFRTSPTTPERDTTDAWDPTGLGSVLSTEQEVNQGELTVNTSGKMWIQFGLRVDTSGGSFAHADVAVMLGIRNV